MQISAQRIKAVMDEPTVATELSDDELNTVLVAVVGLYGTSPGPGLLAKLLPIYRHAVTRLHPAGRIRLYQGIADRVISGDLQPAALLPFLHGDPERNLAAAAALDYAVLAPSAEELPTAGAERILDLAGQGELANPLAVLGGLLMSGDRRLIALVKPAVRELEYADVEALLNCRSSMLLAGVVEFHLEWLEALDSEKDGELFGVVAAGLANLVLAEPGPIVYDIERVIPATLENPVRLLGQWPLASYAASLRPRLERLARMERGEAVMPEVLAAWNLS